MTHPPKKIRPQNLVLGGIFSLMETPGKGQGKQKERLIDASPELSLFSLARWDRFWRLPVFGGLFLARGLVQHRLCTA